MRPLPKGLESLDELDQRPLVIVTQTWFAFERGGTEIVTAIDDEIRTLVQLEKRLRHIGKDFEQLGVGRVLRHREQIMLQPDQKAYQLFDVSDPLERIACLRQWLQIRQQIDRHALWNGADRDIASRIDQLRQQIVNNLVGRAQKIRQKTGRDGV